MVSFDAQRQVSEEDLEIERETLRKEIANLRAHADELEKGFEHIVRARAATRYTKTFLK